MKGNTSILDEVLKRYAQLETYHDEGFIEAIYGCQSADESRFTFRFKTWFRKPKFLRYELFREGALLETIVFDGRHAWSLKPNAKPERCESLWVAAGSLFAGGEIDPYILNSLIPIDMIRFLIMSDRTNYVEKCWLQDEEQHHVRVVSSSGNQADFFISVESQKIRRISRLRYLSSPSAPPTQQASHQSSELPSDAESETCDQIVRTYLVVDWDLAVSDALFEGSK